MTKRFLLVIRFILSLSVNVRAQTVPPDPQMDGASLYRLIIPMVGLSFAPAIQFLSTRALISMEMVKLTMLGYCSQLAARDGAYSCFFHKRMVQQKLSPWKLILRGKAKPKISVSASHYVGTT